MTPSYHGVFVPLEQRSGNESRMPSNERWFRVRDIFVPRGDTLFGQNRDFWAGPTLEVRDSRTSPQFCQIWLTENMKRILCACLRKLGLVRGRHSWCWPKGARPLWTRMGTRLIMIDKKIKLQCRPITMSNFTCFLFPQIFPWRSTFRARIQHKRDWAEKWK